MKKVHTSNDAPSTGKAPLSHAVEANGLVYTSGQIHLNTNMELVGDTTAEKTKQTMVNLESILTTAGLTFADVIKTTVYVTDMSTYGELNETYATYFESDFPAREVVCVKELPLDASLEISMVATR